MKVLVDTSVWSLVLRRAKAAPAVIVQELTELIREGRVVIIGPIRQELLSGIKGDRQFRVLRDQLRAFPDAELNTADFEEAAHFFNRCRSAGIQGSNTDFLMCAVAAGRYLSIFSTDKDFPAFGRLLPVRLHEPRS